MATLLADLVWPALLLEGRVLTWWAIGLGLIVEFFVLRFATSLTLGKCALADIAMNAASALLGMFLIPIAGVAWEFFPGMVIYPLFHMGTFNPLTWAATFILAVLINSVIETATLRYGFNQTPVYRVFWWLCAANAVSVGLALGSVFRYPPRT